MLRTIIAFAATLAIAGPAAAQEAKQTPESAQRFLAINLPTFFSVSMNGQREITATRTTVPTATDTCTTDFKARLGNESNAISWAMGWRSVVDVSNSEGSSYVVVKDKFGFTKGFDFGSAALAARAAFAMEFLRQSCDPAADTGF